LALAALTVSHAAAGTPAPRVEIRTNHGSFVLELYPEQAPQTVDNFLRYVADGFYDGTLFHRVLKDLMIQGGGFTPGMQEKPTRAPIPNEAAHCLHNERGTVAMAHSGADNLAGAQFFINLTDNRGLDYDPASASGAGFCAFGRVVRGMKTIYTIGHIEVMAGGDFVGDVPSEEIIIEHARVLPAQTQSGDDNGKAAYDAGDDHLGP
jgi:cyclophilin family peptidyl-prolyl cis-trans isomerase